MTTASRGGNKTTVKQVVILSLLSVAYVVVSWFLVGFKSDQLVLITVVNLLYYISPGTKKFILGFAVFVVYWIVFDYMKAFPNYMVNKVHIADLYNAEKSIFGISFNGNIITPNEYWRINGTTFLDIMGGFFYLCWIPVPLAFAAYLFFTNKKQFLYFSFTFVLVNFLGFIVYYLYPAAPPWYVQYHGFTFHAGTPGNTAGLVKFDNYFHAGIFKSIYSKGSNVFAAMPSLHSSYPVIVLYYSLKNKLGLANVFFAIVMIGIWFTAVYASHHYILDVLAGILCAFCGIGLFNILVKYNRRFRSFTDNYFSAIQ
jgi:hypothetical protein